MWKVVLINFSTERMFNTAEEALRFAKSTGFECAIYNGSSPFATWNPISGYKQSFLTCKT